MDRVRRQIHYEYIERLGLTGRNRTVCVRNTCREWQSQYGTIYVHAPRNQQGFGMVDCKKIFEPFC